MSQQVSLLGPTGGQEVRRDQVVRDRPHREGRGQQGPVSETRKPHSGSGRAGFNSQMQLIMPNDQLHLPVKSCEPKLQREE